jgi:hypothetical protein
MARAEKNPLCRFALEAAGGLALAALFTTALCALDLHGLGTLIARDEAPGVALLLLLAGLGGTFAVAVFGTGLCLSTVTSDGPS